MSADLAPADFHALVSQSAVNVAADPTFVARKPLSFVRRSGRMTPSQQRAWETLRAKYLLPVSGGAEGNVDRAQRYDSAAIFGRNAELVVEIGSGQGQQILAAAAAHPERNFLALEVFRAGLARTMLRAEQAQLQNLRLAEVNAPELLEHYLPAATVSELWIFFPDPWKKAKHHKRRLIDADFVAIARRALVSGGLLRLSTDWQHYAESMRDVLDAAPGFRRAFAGEWADRYAERVRTAFEQKGLAQGREIRDLTYIAE